MKRPVAVALAYRPEEDPAPRVVASGWGLLAEKILTLAEENGVPIRRDAPLAEMLATTPPGAVIPPQAWQAVAELLAFLAAADAELAAKLAGIGKSFPSDSNPSAKGATPHSGTPNA